MCSQRTVICISNKSIILQVFSCLMPTQQSTRWSTLVASPRSRRPTVKYGSTSHRSSIVSPEISQFSNVKQATNEGNANVYMWNKKRGLCKASVCGIFSRFILSLYGIYNFVIIAFKNVESRLFTKLLLTHNSSSNVGFRLVGAIN